MHGNSLDEEEPDSPSLTYMSYPELNRTSFIIQSLNKKLEHHSEISREMLETV